MKNKFTEIANEELKGIEGLQLLKEIGIDEIISYLDDEEEVMDEFDFEQNILYYMDCKNETQRKQVEIASQKMYPYYKK